MQSATKAAVARDSVVVDGVVVDGVVVWSAERRLVPQRDFRGPTGGRDAPAPGRPPKVSLGD